MSEVNVPEAAADTISIGRLPVFDEKRRLWGYALHCLGDAVRYREDAPEEQNVVFRVAASAYIGLQKIVARNKKLIVDVTEKNLLDNLPYALPPEQTAIQISETIFGHPSVPRALEVLKKDGYLLAVADFSNRTEYETLYTSADIISFDVQGKTREALTAARVAASNYQAILLACGVDDFSRFRFFKEIGFELFQGAFYKTPESITIRQLSSNEMSRFNLMTTIQQEEVDIDQLAEVLQADASLSFRLLAYLNSATFGFRQKIKSIHQAIQLLGWRKLRIWLRVVLLNDVNRSQDASELMLLAAQRGKFLELIGEAYDYWGFDPESLHMLGIFSLLDAMLGMPMSEITSYLPLDEKLKSALCRDPDNEYLPLLELARQLEEHRRATAEEMIRELNMDSGVVKQALQKSIDWANELHNLHGDIAGNG